MSRRSLRRRKRNLSGLYLLVVCVLLIGAMLFGLSLLKKPASTVSEVSHPSVGKAPQALATQKPAAVKTKKTSQEISKEKPAHKDARKEPAQKVQQQAQPQQQPQPQQQQVQPQQQASAGSSAPAPSSDALYLTVPKMGLSDVAVGSGVDEATLYNGPGHALQSGFPWQPGSNVYIASHVLGYSGTGSYLSFARLPDMANGDYIYLTDSNGTTYTYQVFEILQVPPTAGWVVDPTGQDIVSLQTCIDPPVYDIRLIVRGKLVNVQPA